MVMNWNLIFWFACAQSNSERTHEHGVEAVQETVWSENFEAFVEYPPLIKGEEARILAHMTWLEGHRAVETGSLTVHLRNETEHYQVAVDSPARTGIFIPILTPEATGEYRLILTVAAEGVQEDINLGEVKVSTSENGHSHQHSVQNEVVEPEIVLLKEQAWKMDFQTDPVGMQELKSSVDLSGFWDYSPLNKEKVVATTSGIVSFTEKMPLSGENFEKGETIATIQSGDLSNGGLFLRWQQQQALWTKVQAEYDRKTVLLEKGIVSQAQWEEVEQRYKMIKVEYEILSKNTRGGVRNISASTDSILFAIFIENGDFVQLGEELFSLVHAKPSILQVELPQRYLSSIKDIKEVAYRHGKSWQTFSDAQFFVSKGMEHSKEMLLLQIEVKTDIEAVAGALIDIRLLFGESKSSLAIPRSSLLEEYGEYSVIVQTSGEGFVLRDLKIGKRNAEYVEVISGLEEGDWVVSKGAYLVKMMGLSGKVPEHGHAH
jgi:membrane fusion protein, heavy metal efflux system